MLSVERAIALAEATAQWKLFPLVECGSQKAISAAKEINLAAWKVACAAASAASAMETARHTADDRHFFHVARTVTICIEITDCIPENLQESISNGIAQNLQNDFQTVASEAARLCWDDETPVPPTVFGPLWPEGYPVGWPIASQLQQGIIPTMNKAELSSLDRFDEEYPEELSDRLQWLEDQLHVSRGRILRLMGLSNAEAASVAKLPWSKITQKYNLQADEAEHLLTDYLSYFGYETERAADFVRELSDKIKRKLYCLNDDIPTLSSTQTPAEQEEALLEAIRQEDDTILPGLAYFLAQPEKTM